MARIDYADKARRTRERYLYPENDRATVSDIALPALEFLFFLTPPGKKLMNWAGKQMSKPFKGLASKVMSGGAKRYAKSGVKGLSGKAASLSNKIAGTEATEKFGNWWERGSANRLKTANKTANWIENKGRKLFGYAERTMENPLPGGPSIVNFIGKHPGKIALGAAAFGGLMAMAPRDKKQPIADIGSGYPEGTTWMRRDKQPMSPGHLGATGDLVFALRNGR